MIQLFSSKRQAMTLKRSQHIVQQINAREPHYTAMDNEQLAQQTQYFREQLQTGQTENDILVDVFALTREASRRILHMRHFDVQLQGGIFLHYGFVAEMKTGEGKTLVATLPSVLNALSGRGAHVVTVNDYLAERDSKTMQKLFNFLGLSVGCIVNDMNDDQRRQAYACDITYGTNNEIGFDYLRDNMKFHRDHFVQRPFNFAIVDEADSALIDEARTPLIISGPAEDSSELYALVNTWIPQLSSGDYEKDEKSRNILLTEQGVDVMEKIAAASGILKGKSLFDIDNTSLVHHITQALRAHHMFARNTDYIIKQDKVLIIDEFTGRSMEGRRYSDGLHQALEAKEHVTIEPENQTMASVTFQNLFRLYPKLCGMTGTAMTEAQEFSEIYNLNVIEIPTHRPIARIDANDEIYCTMAEKEKAIIEHIQKCYDKRQPVLVGTVSIEKSEQLSHALTKHHIPHNVLNARYHQKEASIIAQAGVPGTVTIATNMAGRGTDIKLGGDLEIQIQEACAELEDDAAHHEVEAQIREKHKKMAEEARHAGGIMVVGTERHEARRIDNQLRGRSGRQGDPGGSIFFLSLEDDLMRIFGSERLHGMLQKLGIKEGEAITHPWMNRALEKAQKKVEARNFDMRKHLLKYDNVMNEQRQTIYQLRNDMLSPSDEKHIDDILRNIFREHASDCIIDIINPKDLPENWNFNTLNDRLSALCHKIDWKTDFDAWLSSQEAHRVKASDLEQHITQKFNDCLNDMINDSPNVIKTFPRLMLHALDAAWKEHLHALDHLRQGVHLRAYGQKDPLNEYKHEAFTLFHFMLQNWHMQVMTQLFQLNAQTDHLNESSENLQLIFEQLNQRIHKEHEDDAMIQTDETTESLTQFITPPESRNAACPCGSGKRYKHCHGAF